eukprot:TRINITY_DN1798_c1_g1_i4.p1 TRINITY_DN1798_c1_g1~~TRINITY_DN1798_c1_g1_i4.p1  ORF type:complete len:282 (+),score=100.32 TRINITY_DN1798_c1_g1_i4:63-908(+)
MAPVPGLILNVSEASRTRICRLKARHEPAVQVLRVAADRKLTPRSRSTPPADALPPLRVSGSATGQAALRAATSTPAMSLRHTTFRLDAEAVPRGRTVNRVPTPGTLESTPPTGPVSAHEAGARAQYGRFRGAERVEELEERLRIERDARETTQNDMQVLKGKQQAMLQNLSMKELTSLKLACAQHERKEAALMLEEERRRTNEIPGQHIPYLSMASRERKKGKKTYISTLAQPLVNGMDKSRECFIWKRMREYNISHDPGAESKGKRSYKAPEDALDSTC